MSFEFQVYIIPVSVPRNAPAPPPGGIPPQPVVDKTFIVIFKETISNLLGLANHTSPEVLKVEKVYPIKDIPGGVLPPPSSGRSQPNSFDGGRRPAETHNNNTVSPANQHNHGTQPAHKSSNEPSKSSEAQPEENNTEKPMPEPERKGEEAPNKSMDDLAREIKKLIPEKFNFVFQPGIHFRAPQQNQGAKAEKFVPEELQQKAPATKSQSAAKGEAKTIQQSEVPEAIDPAERLNKEMFHNVVGKLPAKDAELPTVFPQAKVEIKTPEQALQNIMKVIPQEKAENQPPVQPQVAPTPAKSENTNSLPSTRQPESTTPSSLAPKSPVTIHPAQVIPPTPHMVVPPKTEQNVQPNQPMAPYTNPTDPSKLVAKGHAHIGKIPDGRETSHVKPRQDAVTPRDKNEPHGINPQVQKHEEKHIPQFPILPDFALSKEGILKEKSHGGEVVLRDDEGFKLEDLVLMLLCAVICGARKVEEVHRYLNARAAFFTTWMGLKNGLPSHRLLSILMYRLDPAKIQELYLSALGKRASAKSGVRVWESDRGVVIGMLSTETSLDAFEALDIFDLKSAIVTTDPQRLEAKLSRALQRKDADYLIAVKGKHGQAYDSAQEFFGVTLHEKNVRHDILHHVMQEGDRVMQREVLVADNVAWLPEHNAWTSLRSAIRLKAEIFSGTRVIHETRVYVSSLPPEAQVVAGALRSHSTFENRVEWFLDLDFTRGGVQHVMENFDALRKISWELLNFENSQKATPEAKRKKALTDNTYLRQVLNVA